MGIVGASFQANVLKYIKLKIIYPFRNEKDEIVVYYPVFISFHVNDGKVHLIYCVFLIYKK